MSENIRVIEAPQMPDPHELEREILEQGLLSAEIIDEAYREGPGTAGRFDARPPISNFPPSIEGFGNRVREIV